MSSRTPAQIEGVGKAQATKRAKAAATKQNKVTKTTAAKAATNRPRTRRPVPAANPRPDSDEEEEDNSDAVNGDEDENEDMADQNDQFNGFPEDRIMADASETPAEKRERLTFENDERRKEEKHRLEMAALQVPLVAARTIAPPDDFGEGTLTPRLRDSLSIFKKYNKKDVIAIAKNTFHPLNLPKLSQMSSALKTTTELEMIWENGRMEGREAIGKPAAFGKNSEIWSDNFLKYVAIIGHFHEPTSPGLLQALITFHLRIVKLAKTYKWQGAILDLAINFHTERASADIGDVSAWDLPANMVEEYTRDNLLPVTVHAHNSGGGGSTRRGDNNQKPVVKDEEKGTA